jgi:hypothetical protein
VSGCVVAWLRQPMRPLKSRNRLRRSRIDRIGAPEALSHPFYRPAHENICDRASGGHSTTREAGEGTNRMQSTGCLLCVVVWEFEARVDSVGSSPVSTSPVELAIKERGARPDNEDVLDTRLAG